MITLKLQYNASDKDHFTKEVTDVYTMSGTMKNDSSIVDPVLILESAETLTNINYLTIPEFGRSYFITNIEVLQTNLWRITAHCDVLSSFRDQILQNTAVIRRQENLWNMYLDDGIFKSYQNPDIITKAFPSGFTTQEFVLAVAGG